MNEPKAPLRKGRKPAAGDKRQFLATMDPEVIKAIKKAAIEDETSASGFRKRPREDGWSSGSRN